MDFHIFELAVEADFVYCVICAFPHFDEHDENMKSILFGFIPKRLARNKRQFRYSTHHFLILIDPYSPSQWPDGRRLR
jgi:hypothetical protein